MCGAAFLFLKNRQISLICVERLRAVCFVVCLDLDFLNDLTCPLCVFVQAFWAEPGPQHFDREQTSVLFITFDEMPKRSKI